MFDSCVLVISLLAGLCPTAVQSENLLVNASFEELATDGTPAGWVLWSPREEIAPVLGIDNSVARNGGRSAKMSSSGHYTVHGRLQQAIAAVTPGQSYAFTAYCRAEGVRSLHESVGVKLTWRDAAGRVVVEGLLLEGTPARDVWNSNAYRMSGIPS